MGPLQRPSCLQRQDERINGEGAKGSCGPSLDAFPASHSFQFLRNWTSHSLFLTFHLAKISSGRCPQGAIALELYRLGDYQWFCGEKHGDKMVGRLEDFSITPPKTIIVELPFGMLGSKLIEVHPASDQERARYLAIGGKCLESEEPTAGPGTAGVL